MKLCSLAETAADWPAATGKSAVEKPRRHAHKQGGKPNTDATVNKIGIDNDSHLYIIHSLPWLPETERGRNAEQP